MPDEQFLSELKFQFERFIQIKERLDTKANNMIMMAGTIMVIFMGFGAYLLSNVVFIHHLIFPSISVLIFMAEIILTLFTIKYALNSYKLRIYHHPISFEIFFINNQINLDIVDQFKNSKQSEMNEHFIEEYLKSIKSYEQQNDLQTSGINHAQICFLGSIIMVPTFAFFIILSRFFSV